jgi:hypothetical protein
MPLLEFWSILLIKAHHYIYIQQQHISFWSYLSLYSPRWFLFNLITLILLFLVGFSINFFASTVDKFSWRLALVVAIILIGIEQLAQFIVVNNHAAIDISIIEGWLRITPLRVIHDSEYYVSTKLANQLFLSVFYPATIVIFYFAYRCYYFFLPKQRRLLAISVGFCVSVIVDTCLNWLANNHGYDYIEIEYMMIFNINDVYLKLWLSTFFLLLAEAVPYLKKYKNFTSLKPKIAEYSRWERTAWINIFNRLKLFLQSHRKVIKKG